MLRTPPNHRPLLTEDGTYTLFSENFQEACHSISGAKEETLLHYIKGCQILERFSAHSPFRILEVGFGLGVGFLTTKEKLAEGNWEFVSLELDRDLLDWFKEEHPELELKWEGNLLRGKNLTVIQGNAREYLPKFLAQTPLKFHAIYQDAFSPRRTPSLWTREWFSLLRECSHEDVILSTYSASTSIRKSMHEAGWGVYSGEKFGTKRTSTRACLSRKTEESILSQLERSPVSALSDLNIEEFQTKVKG